MIKIKLAAIAAILLGPSAALYAMKGWRLERTLPSVLCAQSLLLLFLGYALPFSCGVYLVAALSAAAWLLAAVRIKSVRKAIVFFNLPCLLFLISIPILYQACARRVYLSFDEYSHWGLIVKTITLFDELPRAGRGAPLIMFTYPPAGAMLPSLACTLFPYRDGIANFGYELMITGMMIGLLPENGRREERLGALMIFLCIMMIFPLSYLRLFTEPVIAILAALLIVRRGGERTRFGAVSECLYAVMLAMMKNTGIVILAFMLIARLIVRPNRAEAKACLRMLLLSAAACATYAVYCRVQGIAATMSPSHFSENLAALLGGTIADAYTTLPGRFLRFFFTEALPQAGIYSCYGFGTCAIVYGALLLLSGVHVYVAQDRRKALRGWCAVWLINLLYVLMIAVSYCFFFEEAEVERLSEADRYLMLPALWTGLMFCSLLLHERAAGRKRLRCAAICLATLVFVPLSHPEMIYNTFFTQEYVERTLWARAETDEQSAFLKDCLDGEGETKLLCMGDYQYVFLHFALAGLTDIGSVQSSWASAPWQGDCDAVRRELESGGYTHVFVAQLGEQTDSDGQQPANDVIDGRYAPLTADGAALCAQSLYRVERDAQGGVSLVYMATMPEEVY